MIEDLRIDIFAKENDKIWIFCKPKFIAHGDVSEFKAMQKKRLTKVTMPDKNEAVIDFKPFAVD